MKKLVAEILEKTATYKIELPSTSAISEIKPGTPIRISEVSPPFRSLLEDNPIDQMDVEVLPPPPQVASSMLLKLRRRDGLEQQIRIDLSSFLHRPYSHDFTSRFLHHLTVELRLQTKQDPWPISDLEADYLARSMIQRLKVNKENMLVASMEHELDNHRQMLSANAQMILSMGPQDYAELLHRQIEEERLQESSEPQRLSDAQLARRLREHRGSAKKSEREDS